MIKKIRKPWQPEVPKTNESWAYDQRYHTVRWRNYRKAYLKGRICSECKKAGKLIPATTVGHIIPVSERPDLFWEQSNHTPLCTSCNNRTNKK